MKVPNIVVQLVHIDGPYKGRIDEFTSEVITIGRDPKCHLAFPPDMNIISRRHAEIRREGNRFKIIDFSTNGTFIRGEAIEEEYLKNGDVIVFAEEGPKVSFLTMVKEEAETDADETLDRPAPEPAPPVTERPAVTPPASPARPSVEAPPVVSFTIQYGPSIHTFKQASLKIGSDQRCDFILQEPGIAAFHIEVFYQNGHYWVKDLSGEARALLNDRPLINPTVLRYGDLVTLVRGGTVFEYMGDGKLSQKMVVPQQPPVQPPQLQQTPPQPRSAAGIPPTPQSPQHVPPRPQVPPAAPRLKKEKPSPPPSIPTPQPRRGPSRFSIPMWVWVALGSAAVVAVIVYFVAQWGSQ